MISRSDVEAAWARIRPHVRRTPVIELPPGVFGGSTPLALKLEIAAAQRIVQGPWRLSQATRVERA